MLDKIPTIQISFDQNMQKLNRRGEAPIFGKVSVNGVPSQFSTSIFIKPDNWDSEQKSFTNLGEREEIYDALLSKYKAEVYKHFFLLLEQGKVVSANILCKALKGKGQRYLLLTVAQEYLKKQQKRIQNDIRKSTYRTYLIYFANLEQYLNEIGQKKLFLEEVNVKFVEEFKEYLLYEKGHGFDHTRKVIGFLKRVIRYAHLYQYISYNSVSSYQVQRTTPRPLVFLEEDELDRLMNYHFVSPRIQEAADLFKFQCWTGLAYGDLMLFSRAFIERGLDNHDWLDYERIKVPGSRAVLPLLQEAESILEKYAYQLPRISNGKYNAYLKEVADILGIAKRLTTHVGRKTFGMIMLNRGIPIETVSRMLGHASIRETQKGYAKILERRIAKDMRGLLPGKREKVAKLIVLR